ncbi:MAG TPA: hypothetical protein VKQ30_05670 [Ktedonobacterales bacterium]|nr:hypothetical protein [Ktedonobacterales bacterium]
MVHRDARYLAAAMQGLVGWEWLVSGANKVLSGTFPSGLSNTLDASMKNNPNGWYLAILRGVVLPHGVFFGYLIEITEVLTGIALLAGTVLLIGGIRHRDEPQFGLARAQVIAAAIAALACGFLCINFHFYMGDSIIPGFDPSSPFNEGIDLDTLMAPIALLIFLFNLYVLGDMNGVSMLNPIRRAADRVRVLFTPQQYLAPHPADGTPN